MLTLSVIVVLGLSQVMGQYGGGYGGMMGGMMGHKMGGMYGGGHHMMPMKDHSNDADDLLLNCLSTFVDVNGAVTSSLAVNIEEKSSSSSMGGHHGMGHMMGGKMGYGMGYGNRFGMMGGKMGYGMGGYGKGMMGGHGMNNNGGNGLEASVEIVSNVAGGTGYVVFTERANPAEGCTAENFGNVLVNNMMSGNHMGGGHMGGMVNPMMKMGMGYGKYAYGMGGYGLMGAGYGMGMGMGHKMGGMYGSHHGSNNMDDDAGVVAELDILPTQLTSASISDLGFRSLRDLAGRGVAICSEVTYDSNWVPTCKEPYFSCCALKYDDKKAVIK